MTAHRECAQSFAAGLTHALECGRLLILAKRRVRHGDWETWLKTNCQIPERLAQKYMRVTRELPKLQERDPANTPRVADLSFRRALELVAENAETTRNLALPERQRTLDRADEADRPTTIREAAREVRAEDRRNRDQAERQRRRSLTRQPHDDEVMDIESPFSPSELGSSTVSPPPMMFNAEGGFRVDVPGLSADELDSITAEIDRHQRWYACLVDHLRNTLGSYHSAINEADALEQHLVSLLEALNE
jgi:hypothetical protein